MPPDPFDTDQAPFIVIWETTRACDLACAHCRAEAQPQPLPGELSHEEGLALIDQIAALGTPVLVFSGGDPLKRRRLPDLIRHAKARGLRVGTIPAATPHLTREAVRSLHEAGVDQMALSLDASTAKAHDAFRGVPGAFHRTMAACAWAHLERVPLQINTVIRRETPDDLEPLIALIQRLGIVFWEVFFLVPMGRGASIAGLGAQEYEAIFATLFALQRSARFVIKVTEAPHYRRYLAQRRREMAGLPAMEPRAAIGLAPMSINAGKGHLFVSSTGEVYPSGFLPVPTGNIREHALASLYRDSPLFRELRDVNRLRGRCGRCEYRSLCGGSRARAFALTGDYLAEEPCCAYVPKAIAQY